MKQCSKCGSINKAEDVFCANCGNQLEDTPSESSEKLSINTCNQFDVEDQERQKQHKVSKTKKKSKIIALIIGVVLFFAMVVEIMLLLNNNILFSLPDNTGVQANMANWGFVVYDENNIYYSDGKTGIYILNGNNGDLLIEG